MAFDVTHGRVVLFGGGPLNDTWEWNGDLWTQTADTVLGADCVAVQCEKASGRVLDASRITIERSHTDRRVVVASRIVKERSMTDGCVLGTSCVTS
jgi:hypothetical protein